MNRRSLPIVAMVGLAVTVACGVGGLLVRIVWPAPILPTTFGVGPNALIGIAALGIIWSTVGTLLAIRRPENPVGGLMVLVGGGLAMSVLTVAVAFAALDDGTETGRQVASAAGALNSLLTPILVFVFYLPFIFPTGHGHTPRWETLGRVFLGVAMVASALLVLQPGDVHLLPGIHNPIGFGPDLRPVFGERVVAGVEITAVAILLPFLILSVVSRYRQAGQIERRQLKWYILATAVTMSAALLMFAVAAIAAGPMGETPLTVFTVAGSTIPLAIGIAITRYRLYEIDRIISRGLSWALLSGLLIAVYVGAVILLQGLLGGVTQGETVAVAGSTLLAATLFQPLRRRIQSVVDRRFNRARYDAERTAIDFAERLRDEVDLGSLRSDIAVVVDRALRPSRIGVWIRRPGPTDP